jgi:hypothetical protein
LHFEQKVFDKQLIAPLNSINLTAICPNILILPKLGQQITFVFWQDSADKLKN